MWFWSSKCLDTKETSLVFYRIQRFYNTFIALAALISGLSVALLAISTAHPSTTSLNQVGDGFLCSSALTAPVSAVVATMLRFHFEGLLGITQMDLIMAWMPLVLLDVSIIELLIGVACWYSAHNVYWRGVVMASQLAGLLGLCIALSIRMRFYMSQYGEQRKEERQAINTQSHD
ncbi:hypothetical protein EDB81DRAFT_921353 [Dactylonectria macrodidyma]|uniref:Transmembrane protein n=1 Tax=Dactylonectria macrodidyma TaxID=307937 RepID=A0A9P9D6Y7_9HYPO|nr:hypothetical protein EDB81DRAFT_921353 [Dactylonectria macrodidyma]